MKKIALITGATAGIGSSFARLLAKKDYDLVLVARDETRLQEFAKRLSSEYSVDCEVLRADLSVAEQVALVETRLIDSARPIEVLINNAGFALKESFLKSAIAAEQEHFDVLVRTPMRLMHAVLPEMKSRDSGVIINVSSVASWLTGGSYSAAKSYLTVLSESLHSELRGTTVKVMALCPGFTHTEFHQRAKMRMGGLPEFMWLKSDEVVEKAWNDASAGKAISIPGRQYQILSTLARFLPRPLIRNFGTTIRRKQRGK